MPVIGLEKTFDRNLESVKKEWANVKTQNAFLWWRHGIIDETVRESEKDVGVSFKTSAESSQQNVLQVALFVGAAFSKHLERSTEQAGWTKPQISNDLKTLVLRSYASVHLEIARCTAVLFNRVIAVKAARSEALHMSKTWVHDEMKKADCDGKDTNSGAGPNAVDLSSS